MRIFRGRGPTGPLLGLLAALVLLPMAAWAGPYEDADAAFRQGDYRTAISLLQQAQQQTPNDARVYAALGRSYRKLGDDNAARDAYTEFLRRDPNLRTLKSDADRQKFMEAFRSIGGQVPAPAQGGNGGGQGGSVGGERVSASDIINALNRDNVYVVPSLRNEIDAGRLAQVAASAAPNKAKILVVKQLGGYASREALAADLAKRLNLGKYDVFIVMTPKGISAYNERFSSAEAADILRRANLDSILSESGPTEAAATAIQAMAGASQGAASGDSSRKNGFVILLIAGIGGFFLWRNAKKKKEMDDARAPVEQLRQKVLADLSYVDGYLDLLPVGPDATQAKQLRASAFERFDTATGFLKSARNPQEIRHAQPLLQMAADELLECRKAIDRATGGTGVAMGLLETPDLATDVQKAERYRKAEELRSEEERRRMQEEIDQIPVEERGVSFFSGQPMPAGQLVPVTIVVQGKRRTVMATPEEAAAIMRGETPQIRVFQDPVTRRNVPWYEYRNYDPYRDYYGYGPSVVFVPPIYVPIYDVAYDYGPAVYDHYGGWGYGGYGWGMPEPPSGVYTADPGMSGGWSQQGGGFMDATPEHAGGFDFFGQQGYNEQGPSFDSGSDDSGSTWSSDSSSFDSGSSWSSSDSGGGFDSSSSSDSGSSSSDFGGSSDW